MHAQHTQQRSVDSAGCAGPRAKLALHALHFVDTLLSRCSTQATLQTRRAAVLTAGAAATVAFAAAYLTRGGAPAAQAARLLSEAMRAEGAAARQAALPHAAALVAAARGGDAAGAAAATGALWMLAMLPAAAAPIVAADGVPLLVHLLSHKVRPRFPSCATCPTVARPVASLVRNLTYRGRSGGLPCAALPVQQNRHVQVYQVVFHAHGALRCLSNDDDARAVILACKPPPWYGNTVERPRAPRPTLPLPESLAPAPDVTVGAWMETMLA